MYLQKRKILKETSFTKDFKTKPYLESNNSLTPDTPTTSEATCPQKVILNNHFIEYDYWIDEKTMTFFLFPKNSNDNYKKHTVIRKSQPKSKAHSPASKPNSEPKNSVTH